MKRTTPMKELLDRLVQKSNYLYFNGTKRECDVIDSITNIVRSEFISKEREYRIEFAKTHVTKALEAAAESTGNDGIHVYYPEILTAYPLENIK